MKKSRHIASLLLMVFAVAFSFKLLSGLLCSCEGHSHSMEYICVDLHHHLSHHTHHCEPSKDPIVDMNGDCVHFKVLELEASVPNTTVNQIIPQQYISAYFLLYSKCADYVDEPLYDKESYLDDRLSLIESQWSTAALWQRPPPALA